jgi:hypothetical protein
LNVILETLEALKKGQQLHPELVGIQVARYMRLRTERQYEPLKLVRDNE